MNLSELGLRIPFYPEDLVPICLILLAVCLGEWLIPKKLGYRSNARHQVLKVLFAAYLLAIFEMTVSLESLWVSWGQGFPVKGDVMLTPFQEIRNFWNYGSQQEILFNLVGNVLTFLPMGLLPPLLWKWARWPWFAALWMVIPSCVIEFCQLFTPRTTSVDDVILNASGALCGYLLFLLLRLCGLGQHTILTRPGKKPKHVLPN